MRSILFATLGFSILNFTIAAPDSGLRIFHKRDLCTENYQVDCYDNCMPPDGVCCDDGSGTYCPFGEYCVPNGCCPNGEHCSGGGGTITYDVLTGTGTLPTNTIPTGVATTAAATYTTPYYTPTAVQTTQTTVAQATNSGNQATTNLNFQTQQTTVTNRPATTTTSSSGQFTSSGNALSALSHGLERYALLLIAGGQLLLGW